MKLLALSLILVVLSIVGPLPARGGDGEWPCRLTLVLDVSSSGLTPELDCRGNSGDCLCTIFTY